jgi:hypothetical protein
LWRRHAEHRQFTDHDDCARPVDLVEHDADRGPEPDDHIVGQDLREQFHDVGGYDVDQYHDAGRFDHDHVIR